MASHRFVRARGQHGQRLHLERSGLVREHGGIQRICGKLLIIGGGLYGIPGSRPYREGELLHPPVPVFYLPEYGFLFLIPDHPDFVAQWCKICSAANIDRMLRTCLNAGITLPTEIGLNVVSPPVNRVDVHNVGRADIHALSTAVTLCHINEGGHINHLPFVAPCPCPGRSDEPFASSILCWKATTGL